MPAAVADHLWQSLLFCALAAMLARLARDNPAFVRLWLWRICALKFLAPFALLFALGEWLGFPLVHSADPLPEPLLRGAAAITPWVSPAQSGILPRIGVVAFLLAGLAATWVCLRLATGKVRVEFERAGQETWLLHAAADDAPPALGFFKAGLFTSCAIWCIGGALLGGAISDGNWRRTLLIENSHALRDAPVVMIVAEPGMGSRSRIFAGSDGVLIRNINLQDLIAVSYGVSHFSVTTNQMYSAEADPKLNSWLRVPYYDVRISASIREPDQFDPYALRQRVTRLLVERFGLEIHVNGHCQPPCGRWDKRRDDRPL
ncbi:MAG TPA: hypothetical protein VFO82_16490 [Steroidobacteraceae bacterium]|nr:hypothetical protein [Steroidobacteraceae bacterium]